MRREARAARRRYLNRFLAAFMARMQRVAAARWPAMFRQHPEWPRPCEGCAFRPSTNTWKGADSTAWGLMQALRDGRPFFCHHGMTKDSAGQYVPRFKSDGTLDVNGMELCAGYTAVAGEVNTEAECREALREIGPPSRLESLGVERGASGQDPDL